MNVLSSAILRSHKYRWVLPPVEDSREGFSNDLDTCLKGFLQTRQRTLEETFPQAFAQDVLQSLPSPHDMKDLDRAAERIALSVERNEKFAIFGDYDVDGTTACAMLRLFFAEYGITPVIYIPDRLKEGYGLNPVGLEKLAQQGVQLVVSVDNGIAAVDACRKGRELGLDVIITDHHEPPERLPEAFAIVNPKQTDCRFPFQDLAGVGVAFYLLIALRQRLRDLFPQVQVNLKSYLDFVAVGTIADVCPLHGLNHALTRLGLEVLNHHRMRGNRPGLAALAEIAGIDPQAPLTSEHVAFQLGPRLNAAGRLGTALATEELLSTPSPERARSLARLLNEENQQRRQLEKRTVDEAVHEISELWGAANSEKPAAIVAFAPDWHPGVLGIVASRLVDKFYVPALVLTQVSEDGAPPLLKGSARSTEEINLFALLLPYKDEFLSFGGHAKALGFSLAPEKRKWLQELVPRVVNETADDYAEEFPNQASLRVDSRLGLDDWGQDIPTALDVLEPYGFANPRPRFLLRRVRIADMKPIGKNPQDGHCRIWLEDDRVRCSEVFVGFGLLKTPDQNQFVVGAEVDAVCECSWGYWRGVRRVESRIVDWRLSNAPEIE